MRLAAQAGGGAAGGDLISEVGNEIEVTLDRWSVGQLEVTDLIAAASVVAVGVVLAWVTRRISRRIARRTTGAARSAIAVAGLLIASSLVLLAFALALEMLGFSLGPILVIVLIAVVTLLLLRPLITNLSSGLLLQARGALEPGDLVQTNNALGVVNEINARSLVLDTADGRRVHVPNSDVLSDTIENYSSRGRRRSSLDIMVSCDADIDGVAATVVSALDPLDVVLDDPPPEVQVAALAGRLVVLRVYVWHDPPTAAARAAIDAAARAILAAVEAGTLNLDGPEWMALEVSGSSRPGRGTRDGG